MKRNAAYGVPSPALNNDEEIYDEVELPECMNTHVQQSQQSVKKMTKKTNSHGQNYSTLSFAVGILSILLLLITLIVTSIQMSALQNELKVTCPGLPNPGNGTVTITGSILPHLGVGSKATYSCDPGYELVYGHAVRFCVHTTGYTLTTGRWNGSVPSCQVRCGNFEELEYGSVSLQKLEPNSIISRRVTTYTCDTGYVLIGPSSRECVYTRGGEQGEWRSGSQPTSCKLGIVIDCNKVDCRSTELRCLDQQGLCKVSCNDSQRYACHEAFIQCPSSGGDCIVDCTSDYQYACLQATTICPENGNCVLNCTNDYSCHSVDVVCLNNSNCKVECDGRYSCKYANFTGPGHINCSSRYYRSCYQGNIACQYSGDCLSCSGDRSCQHTTVSFTNYHEASLACYGAWSCQYAEINCPNDEVCNIDCSGNYACWQATINCPQNRECNIFCNGDSSCYNLRVVCSSRGYSCNIKCGNPNADCSQLRITNTASVNLQCCTESACSGAPVSPSLLTYCQ